MAQSRAGTGCAVLVVMAAGLAAGILYRHQPVSIPPKGGLLQPTGPATSVPEGSGLPVRQHDRVLASLFQDDVPAVRIYACELAGKSRDRKWVPALLVRAADQDEAVRRAAFSTLQAFYEGRALDFRADGDLDQQARAVLKLLDHAGSAAEPGLSACELWADASYTAFPPVLVDACLRCHVGENRIPLASNEQCRGCHEEIYAEWVGSAHAQTLSHLHLAAPVDKVGEPVAVEFGELHGISCVECHRITATRDRSRPLPATGPAGCIHVFAKDSSGAEGCARCHADTASQWRDWIAQPSQLHKASWPPGDIVRAPDHRTCVDCHMAESRADSKPPHRDHRWSARRNLPLLRDGIHIAAQVKAVEQTESLIAVLTNTAGHSYPTGTCRRTLELVADDGCESEPAVAVRMGGAYPTQPGAKLAPPLRPGERREIRWPISPRAESVSYRLRYVRDRLNPALYSTDILAGERPLQPWAPAQGEAWERKNVAASGPQE